MCAQNISCVHSCMWINHKKTLVFFSHWTNICPREDIHCLISVKEGKTFSSQMFHRVMWEEKKRPFSSAVLSNPVKSGKHPMIEQLVEPPLAPIIGSNLIFSLTLLQRNWPALLSVASAHWGLWVFMNQQLSINLMSWIWLGHYSTLICCCACCDHYPAAQPHIWL